MSFFHPVEANLCLSWLVDPRLGGHLLGVVRRGQGLPNMSSFTSKWACYCGTCEFWMVLRQKIKEERLKSFCTILYFVVRTSLQAQNWFFYTSRLKELPPNFSSTRFRQVGTCRCFRITPGRVRAHKRNLRENVLLGRWPRSPWMCTITFGADHSEWWLPVRSWRPWEESHVVVPLQAQTSSLMIARSCFSLRSHPAWATTAGDRRALSGTWGNLMNVKDGTTWLFHFHADGKWLHLIYENRSVETLRGMNECQFDVDVKLQHEVITK